MPFRDRFYTLHAMSDELLKRAGDRLLRDARVLAVWGFGSRVGRRPGVRRDVDLAVLLAEPLSLREELRLRAEVVEALGRDDIDLVALNGAPPLLRYEVVATGRLLGAREPAAAERMEERALREYLDTAHLRKVQRLLAREAAQ